MHSGGPAWPHSVPPGLGIQVRALCRGLRAKKTGLWGVVWGGGWRDDLRMVWQERPIRLSTGACSRLSGLGVPLVLAQAEPFSQRLHEPRGPLP